MSAQSNKTILDALNKIHEDSALRFYDSLKCVFSNRPLFPDDYGYNQLVDIGVLIKQFDEELRDEFGDSERDYMSYPDTVPDELSGVKLTVTDSYGGEGEGDSYWIVMLIAAPGGIDFYAKADGWYSSYDGGGFDDNAFEVIPKEVVKIEWERKDKNGD